MARKTVAKKKKPEAAPPVHTGHALAISIEKIGGKWICAVYHLKDGVVVQRTTTEPDLRANAIERFKVKASQIFFMV
jgi:hypothetical protein